VHFKYLWHKHTEFELTGKFLRGVLERLKFSRPDKNLQNPQNFSPSKILGYMVVSRKLILTDVNFKASK